jgi:hypothetical protein
MSSPNVTSRDVALATVSLFSVTALCVVVYPALAVRVDALVGGRGGSGSSLGYYRDLYVLPAALSFIVVSAAGTTLAARRGRRSLLIVAAGAWLLLLIGLVASVEWYYGAVRSASGLR